MNMAAVVETSMVAKVPMLVTVGHVAIVAQTTKEAVALNGLWRSH